MHGSGHRRFDRLPFRHFPEQIQEALDQQEEEVSSTHGRATEDDDDRNQAFRGPVWSTCETISSAATTTVGHAIQVFDPSRVCPEQWKD